MSTALYVAAYAALSAGGVLLLRSALGDESSLSTVSIRALAGDPRFVFGAVLYAASFLTWLAALRRYEVSRIFPVFVGVGYCAVVIGAYAFLGEHMTASRVAGIAVILAGVVLVVR